MEKLNLLIRNEEPKDYDAVENLVRETFWNLYVPGCSEQLVLHKLRESADFISELDFVAEYNGLIVGQIVYSRGILTSDESAETQVLSFGPVSVLPDFQKQGVGSALITHTISIAKTMGYPAILIYGDPRYYSRFGFRCAEKYDIQTADGYYAVALQALELVPGALERIAGKFQESSAYAIDEEEALQFDAKFPYKEKTETDSQKEFGIMVSLRYPARQAE